MFEELYFISFIIVNFLMTLNNGICIVKQFINKYILNIQFLEEWFIFFPLTIATIYFLLKITFKKKRLPIYLGSSLILYYILYNIFICNEYYPEFYDEYKLHLYFERVQNSYMAVLIFCLFYFHFW
jgi:hypothetical protein